MLLYKERLIKYETHTIKFTYNLLYTYIMVLYIERLIKYQSYTIVLIES